MARRIKIFALALFCFVSLVLLAVPMPAWGQVTVIPVASGGDLQGAINQAAAIINGADLAVVPGFRAAQFEDFSLMQNSPLVNAGIASRPTPFQDFAGNLRDAQPDIGAFEFVTTPVLNVHNNPLRKGPKDQ